MKGMKRDRILLAFVMALFLGRAPLLRAQHESVRARVVDVAVTRPSKGTLTRWIRTMGTVEAKRCLTVSSEIQGRVAQVCVDEGDAVTRGQLLLRFDSAEAEAQVERMDAAVEICRAELALREAGATPEEREAARAAQRQAEARLEGTRCEKDRIVGLLARKAASRQQLDAATAAYEAAKAGAEALAERCKRVLAGAREEEIAMARARCRETAARLRLARIHFDRTRLLAPETGVVTKRCIDEGEVVSQMTLGNPLLEICAMDPIHVLANLPDRDLRHLRPGSLARLRSDAWPEGFEGRLRRVAPTAEARSRMLAVEIEVPNAEGRLRPGMLVQVELRVGHREGVDCVATEALFGPPGGEWVWIVKDGKACRRPLHLGLRDGDRAEILEGLKADEAYVVKGGFGLVEGQDLRVLRP